MDNPTPLRLKTARKKVGFTQQQLGIALGMEPNTASARMNQYEKGKCSGQLNLATVLEFNQNLRSDSFGLKPAL